MCDKCEGKVMLGVGDGTGNLFVEGSMEAIKRVQELILTRSKYEREIAELKSENAMLHKANVGLNSELVKFRDEVENIIQKFELIISAGES